MPKLPRDISGRELTKLLRRFNYAVVRQTGSHIRLISNIKGVEHKLTIPDHSAIKIGTLNNVLNDVAEYLSISKIELIEDLFGG